MTDRPKISAKDAPALSRFNWEDAFLLEDQLTEEERMLRDAARSYAQDRLMPGVIDAYDNEHTDPEIFRQMGEMGLLGVTVRKLQCLLGIFAGDIVFPEPVIRMA